MELFDKEEKVTFEEIDSIIKAKEEVKNGNLETLYLMSPRFGGAKDDRNILYVPIGINEIKERYDNVILELLEQDKVQSYKCKPEYKGKSLIPSKITITSGKDGKNVFEETINIW